MVDENSIEVEVTGASETDPQGVFGVRRRLEPDPTGIEGTGSQL